MARIPLTVWGPTPLWGPKIRAPHWIPFKSSSEAFPNGTPFFSHLAHKVTKYGNVWVKCVCSIETPAENVMVLHRYTFAKECIMLTKENA